MSLDVDEFRRWLLLDRALEPATADRYVGRLEYAMRHGFDVDAFRARDEDQAKAVGDAWLERRLGTVGPATFNADVKWLNHLATYSGLDVSWTRRRPPRPVPRSLTKTQVSSILKLGHRDRVVHRLWRAIVLVELQLGLRVSELAGLEVVDVDVSNSRIHLRNPAKGGPRRWLPMPRWAFSRRRPLGAYLAWRRRQRPSDGALWLRTTSPHTPLTPSSVRDVVYQISQAAGFQVNCTVLRHTCAVLHRRNGRDIRFIKALFGHASYDSTQIYEEYGPEDLAAALARRPPPDPYAQPDRGGGPEDGKKT